MSSLYFFISALETLLVALFFYQSGSAPGDQVAFGLSAQRLVLVAGLGLLALLLLAAGGLNLKENGRFHRWLHRRLDNERWCVWTALVCLALAGAVLFLFSLNPGTFGDWRLIYVQFQPVLSLLFLLTAQTLLVMLVWLTYRFSSIRLSRPEIRRVWLIFSLLSLVKWLLGTSGAYGPVSGDEMEYFSLAYYLSQGSLFQAVDPIHYPPLYPLLLTTSLPFGFYTFDLIKLLNVLFSSSIVFPIYLIARRYLRADQSLLVVLGASLLPFHLVFPRRIQSENLYFPLLYWAIYFTLNNPRDARDRTVWDLISGLLLGLLYLTRYITLALLPAFLLGWSFKVRWKAQPAENRNVRVEPDGLRRLPVLAAAGLATYLPWIADGLAHGYRFKDTLGLFITASVEHPQQLSFANLLAWILIYAAYLVLMAAPVLPFLLQTLSALLHGRLDTRKKQWMLFSLAITALYGAAVVRHSWRANYNAQLPMKIMGRYLIFLAPIFLISALLALRESTRREKRAEWPDALRMVALPIALTGLAYTLLITKSILPIHAGALNALGAVDGYLVSLQGACFFILLLPFYGCYFLLRQKRKAGRLLSVVLLGLCMFYLSALPAYKFVLQEGQPLNFVGYRAAQVLANGSADFPGTDLRLLLPNELSSVEKQRIYQTVQTRGYPQLTPASYNPAKPFTELEAGTYLIWNQQAEWISAQEPAQIFRLGGTDYSLLKF